MLSGMSVVGIDALTPKISAVDCAGRLKLAPIAGLSVRNIRPVPHEDGMLTEIARAGWPELDLPMVQVHLTTTLPGRVRAWGLHRRVTDRLFVARGLVSIVAFDGRLDSPTRGAVNEIRLSERNPGLVIIPPDVFHGWKNLGTDEALIINLPSREYDYETPDALDLPYESARAHEIVPFRW